MSLQKLTDEIKSKSRESSSKNSKSEEQKANIKSETTLKDNANLNKDEWMKSYAKLREKSKLYDQMKQLGEDRSLITRNSEFSEFIEVEDEFGRTRKIRRLEEESAHFDSRKEIRNLGVGFYEFSRGESEREKNLEELQNLRRETESIQRINEERKIKREDIVNRRMKRLEIKLREQKW